MLLRRRRGRGAAGGLTSASAGVGEAAIGSLCKLRRWVRRCHNGVSSVAGGWFAAVGLDCLEQLMVEPPGTPPTIHASAQEHPKAHISQPRTAQDRPIQPPRRPVWSPSVPSEQVCWELARLGIWLRGDGANDRRGDRPTPRRNRSPTDCRIHNSQTPKIMNQNFRTSKL